MELKICLRDEKTRLPQVGERRRDKEGRCRQKFSRHFLNNLHVVKEAVTHCLYYDKHNH